MCHLLSEKSRRLDHSSLERHIPPPGEPAKSPGSSGPVSKGRGGFRTCRNGLTTAVRSAGKNVHCAHRQTRRRSFLRKVDRLARPRKSACPVTCAVNASSTRWHTTSGSASGAV